MKRRDKFAAWRESSEAAISRPARSSTKIYDGAQLIGSVDTVGMRFESFRASGQYLGKFYNRDLAIEAVQSAHRSARVVTGLAG